MGVPTNFVIMVAEDGKQQGMAATEHIDDLALINRMTNFIAESKFKVGHRQTCII